MNTILITGATGAIGSALVPRFLCDRNVRLRLLIRAKDEAHLHERLRTLQEFWGEIETESMERVEALRGDVTLPMLGLEECVYRKLAEEVTHIVHCAGNVKLNQPISEARRSAVVSLQHVVALAHNCQKSGQFSKLDYVSTIGVAGRMQGLIPETPLTEVRDFHNTYEEAKAEAEAWLLGEMKHGLPATIHRPSMVVGDSKTGKIIQFQVFYYLSEFLTGRKTWGIVPNTGNVKLDIIPVDYVARAICLASEHSDTAGRIFHLCSGPCHAISIKEMTSQLHAIFESRGALLPRRKQIQPKWLKRIIPFLSQVAQAKTRRALENLPYFLTYLDETCEFDNSTSNAFFTIHGLKVTSMKDCVERAMRFYLDKKLQKSTRV